MIHPKAEVYTEKIGESTTVWQFAIILAGAQIGENCNINCHTFIENDVIIGNNVTIKSGVYLWDGMRIEDDVFIGPNATFVNNQYARSKVYPEKHIGATIKKGATIGANATIMGDILIGRCAMIGAGSTVLKDVPDYGLIVGNPAKQIGYITPEGRSLSMDFIDKKNGDKYYIASNGMLEKKRYD